MTASFFDARLTTIRSTLREQAAYLANRYIPVKRGDGYTLDIAPERIHFIED